MNSLSRRKLLAAATGSGAVVLTGCLSDSDDKRPSGADENASGPNSENAADPDDENASDLDSEDTADPDDETVSETDDENQYRDEWSGDCPEYDTERTICYDAVAPEEVRGILEPSARTVDAGESISFALQNKSDSTLSTNPYDWRLDKYVEGEWYRIEPVGKRNPVLLVQPAEEHEWTVRIDNDGIEDGTPVDRSSGHSDLTVHGLGGGRYAFRGRGWFDEDTDFAATFEVDDDPIKLTPTDEIEDTQWDDDTLVATTSRGDSDGDVHRSRMFELEQVSDPSESATLIVEQVIRRDRLRDALALVREYDTKRVRLEAYPEQSLTPSVHTDQIYEFQGSYYEISTWELE